MSKEKVIAHFIIGFAFGASLMLIFTSRFTKVVKGTLDISQEKKIEMLRNDVEMLCAEQRAMMVSLEHTIKFLGLE